MLFKGEDIIKQRLKPSNFGYVSLEKRSSNVCIRCGKERIFSKSWEETVTGFMGKSVVTYTETVCPDPECQKLVEKQLAAQKKRREELEQSKEDRKVRLKGQRDRARLHL